MKKCLVTGGCGFIGSNFINHLIENKLADQIINLDKMTYAGNIENLNAIEKNKNVSNTEPFIEDAKGGINQYLFLSLSNT